MQEFLAEADAKGLNVSLGASPLDQRTKLNRLVDFYKSFGFEPTGRSINPAGDPAMLRKAAPMMPDLLQKYMPPSELSLDPNFRKWFEGSKMVDDYGEPLMLYHGTRGDFSAFDPGRIGQSDFGASGRGFYFSQDPGTAGLYAQMSRGEGAPNMLAAYLSALNPLELGAMLPRDAVESALLTQRAREAGHDALIVRNPKDNMLDEVVVFEPTQIKSATGNRGTYDPNDPDIRKARGGLAVKKRKR
jgi:hypothetical protein